MAQQQNLELFASETWPLRWTVVDERGAVKTLVGGSFVWVMKDSAEGSAIFTKSPTIVNGTTNVLETVVAAGENSATPAGTYYHELQVTDSTGKRRKVCWGSLIVRPTGIR